MKKVLDLFLEILLQRSWMARGIIPYDGSRR